MRTNTKSVNRLRTHENAPAVSVSIENQLRRSVMSCMLFEKEFYEDGVSIATRIQDLAAKLPVQTVADLAIEVREKMNLRHVSLWLVIAVINKRLGADFDTASLIERVCKRADEPGELLSLYWSNGRKTIPAAMKKGLARAMQKFDTYQLAKYNRKTEISMKDVLRLVHPKPANNDISNRFGKLLNDNLESPDTWEVGLSSGADKKDTFERLLADGKLNYMALLRNLRNMDSANVDPDLIRDAILARKGAHNVLPFRYVAAARAAPRFEPELDQALMNSINETPQLDGETIILVDVSGSMGHTLSEKSDLSRMDAAATLASIIGGKIRVFTFSEEVVEVAPRRGMSGVSAIKQSQPHRGTYLGAAVKEVSAYKHDRIIVITDEQSHDTVAGPSVEKAYMINVGSSERAIGFGNWTRISGFSERVLEWIREKENAK